MDSRPAEWSAPREHVLGSPGAQARAHVLARTRSVVYARGGRPTKGADGRSDEGCQIEGCAPPPRAGCGVAFWMVGKEGFFELDFFILSAGTSNIKDSHWEVLIDVCE